MRLYYPFVPPLQNLLNSRSNISNNYWFLQGDRKIPVLLSIAAAFMLHVVGVYWWYRSDDLLYPLAMLPPKAIPPFWHAIFIILVNGMETVFIVKFFL